MKYFLYMKRIIYFFIKIIYIFLLRLYNWHYHCNKRDSCDKFPLESANVHICNSPFFYQKGRIGPAQGLDGPHHERVPLGKGRYHFYIKIIFQIISQCVARNRSRRSPRFTRVFYCLRTLVKTARDDANVTVFCRFSHTYVYTYIRISPLRVHARVRVRPGNVTARIAHKASITTSRLRQSSLQFACRRRLHLHTVYYRASSSAGVTQLQTLVPHPSSDAQGRIGERREEGRRELLL